jgi:hypothetical protein
MFFQGNFMCSCIHILFDHCSFRCSMFNILSVDCALHDHFQGWSVFYLLQLDEYTMP